MKGLPNEKRSFMGGMVRDLLAALIPKNQYTEALNMKLTQPDANTLGGVTVSIGNEQVIALPAIVFEADTDDYKGFRILIDNSAPNITHEFSWDGGTGAPFSSALADPALRYAALITALISDALAQGITLTVYLTSPVAGTAVETHVGVRAYGADITCVETITGIGDIEVQVLKEFYGTVCNGVFKPLKSLNIGDDLYVISSNGSVFRLSVGKKNFTTGVWASTIVLETKFIEIPDDAIIDLDGEIDFGTRVSLYLIGEEAWPRALYVTHQDTWSAQYSFTWREIASELETGNSAGFYTHENIEARSQLQVLQNFARIDGPDLLTVNNTGGGLPSGGYYYLFRQLVGNEISTNFSLISNLVSVFADSLTDTEMSGSNGGDPTSKSVDLPITGLDPTLYDKFEIGVLVNTNGVFSSYLLGPYDINGTATTITHTGFETSSSLAVSTLVAQQILIRSGKNLVINRNRLFPSNFTVQVDYDLSEYCIATAGNITLTTERKELNACGTIATPSVAEYQSPTNVFYYTGYMLNETYRFGIIFYFRNGFVSSPYYIADYLIAFASGALTDNAGGVPNKIYTFHPQASVDLTGFPAIDGIPFEEAIEYFSIVRLPCIPEIQETGYFMTHSGSGSGYYGVGKYVGEGAIYDRGPTDSDRTRMGLLSPDILFGAVDPVFTDIHKLYIYGQPTRYAISSQSPTVTDFRSLYEFSGDFDTYEEIGIDKSQTVPFNSEGTLEINSSFKYRTTVSVPNLQAENSQKSVGIGTAVNEYVVAVTANDDYGFYYGQHFVEKLNKYGEAYQGSYISCGHMRQVDGSGTYTEDVYGGDTFTQKNVTKLMNDDTISFEIAAADNPSAPSPLWFHSTYTYTLIGVLPDAVTPVTATTQPVIVKTGANDLYSVLLAWNDYPGMAWNLYRTNGLGSIRLIYTGTANTFTDAFTTGSAAVIPPAVITAINVRTGISYYTQNRINTQLRYFTDEEVNLNYPYQTLSETTWLSNTLDEGTLLYSDSYTPINTLQTMLAFNPDTPVNDKYTNIMQYSGLKIPESPNDPYRKFLPLDRKAYPAIYGAINNTFRDGNSIVILMDSAVLDQPINQQEAITTNSGLALTIGDGSVLGAREGVISLYGAPIKTGAISYLHKGRQYIAWYAKDHQRIMRRGVDGLKDLTEDNYYQSFFNDNNQFVGAERSINMGYDDFSKELLISANATVPDSTLWGDAATFVQGDIVYTSDIPQLACYYKARRAVPADKNPSLPENQLQYWEPYFNSNYTVVFNEKSNCWSGHYSFKFTLALPYKNNFLTWGFLVEPGVTTSALFEHNRGEYLTWYETTFYAYLKNIWNDIPEYYKASRNFWFRCDNQPYYLHVRGNNNTKTYGVQADFVQEREYWWLQTKNDATLNGAVLPTGTNTTGINSLCTSWIEGETIEMTIFFDGENIMNEALHRYLPKRKFPLT